MSERIAKVNSVLRRAIGDIVLLEHNHPSFQMISVVKVDTLKDLSSAKVYVSAIRNQEDLVKYLTKIQPIIQKKLAKRVKLRILPKLKFMLDLETEYLAKMNRLIEVSTPKST